MAKRYGDRWQTIDSLGEGGQARAFRVRDLEDPADEGGWVLKRLKNSSRLERFKDEIEALRRIDSPRIPQVEDCSLDDPPYLVYPYIGPTLDEVAEGLSFDAALGLFIDVVEAVMHAHEQGVVHRDVKPQNVVVGEDSEGRRAYLIDFGICQIENGEAYTLTDEPLGSRSFAAPELEAGAAGPVGPKSDVYSLGKLLYWLVTGGKIFPRESYEPGLSQMPQELGVERQYLRSLLSRTVEIDPNERISAAFLFSDVRIAKRLIRERVNLVGAKDQVCPACRQGTLRRRTGVDIRNTGLSPTGNPDEWFRLLHCSYCGYLQMHDISGTKARGLWEI